MRKYFIDNLRTALILLLFIHHSFWIYNSTGTVYYINGTGNLFLTLVVISQIPWFMPLMFVLAGISTMYSLQKRTSLEYVKERVQKLLIPLLSGILIVIPSITYFAERFHNGYEGNYLQQYILFFTKPTNLTGVTGGFTPGHLWFLFYLLLISLIALPIIMLLKKYVKKIRVENIYFPVLYLLFILPYIGRSVIRISEKGLLQEFIYFMIGYFILSNDIIIEKCKKYYLLSLSISLICLTCIIFEFMNIVILPAVLVNMVKEFYTFCTILGFIGLFRKYFNIKNGVTEYFSKISFGLYIFHFSWIIGLTFYIQKYVFNIWLQLLIVIPLSLFFTIITTELCRRWLVTRKLFGLNK